MIMPKTKIKFFLLLAMVMILLFIKIEGPKRADVARVELGIRHHLVENLVRCIGSYGLDKSNIDQFLPVRFRDQKDNYIILDMNQDSYFSQEITTNVFFFSTKKISADASRKTVFLGRPILIDMYATETNHCIIGFENLSTYSTDMDVCNRIVRGNSFFCTRDKKGKYTIESYNDE